MARTPPFAVARYSFLGFLRECGWSPKLMWVFREDYTSWQRRCWLRVPLPAANAELAQRSFEAGRRHGLGVRIEALCRFEDRTVCYPWWPKNEEEASYAMQPRSLRLTVPTEPVTARGIRHGWLWTARQWLNCRSHGLTQNESIPLRSAVVAALGDK